MIASYIDTSVVLRIILEQEGPLREWDDLELGVASTLIVVECHRALERLLREGQLDENEFENKKAKVRTMLEYLEHISFDETVIARTIERFPTPVATLDAIHLASALVYRASQPDDERPILFATHDKQLATAARALHFEVIGA